MHNPERLGASAAKAFERVALNEADLIVPVIVIAEVIYVLQAGKVQVDIDEVFAQLQASPNVTTAPLTLERALALRGLSDVPEMHARMIVAEAPAQGATLITQDEAITESNLVPTAW